MLCQCDPYAQSSFYELLKGNLAENHFPILTQLEELGKFWVLWKAPTSFIQSALF